MYPELVTHSDGGEVEGVHYELLPALLLNEVQKQAREKDTQIATLRRQVALQRADRCAGRAHECARASGAAD